MIDDDPFSEDDDTDKTVVKPNPGGRRTQPGQQPEQDSTPAEKAPPAAEDAPPATEDAGAESFGVPAGSPAAPRARQGATGEAEEVAMTGMNRLNACAAPLFSLISRIRNRAQHLDPDKLRQSVIAEVRAFENRTLQAGIPAQDVKVARYALCAVLDDVVLNTPWGGQSSWGLQSMVGTFHRETVGGDRFYDLLARLEKDPTNNLDLLEFIYMCLSLGFEGRLRVESGGAEKHLQIRNSLARIIRTQRGAVEWDLSVNWKGLDKPFRPLSAWRLVWIALAVTGVLLAGQYTGLSLALANQTENLTGRLSAIDTGPPATLERRAPPPPPTPQNDDKVEKIESFLQEEMEDGIVEVFEEGNVLTIRLAGSGMFGSGSDQVKERFLEPIGRISDALTEESGNVIITGHSDNIPISSSRFQSNMHLSLARAKAVMEIMAETLEDPSRLSAEGRADSEPIADNDTSEGRAANRRIEVLLVQEQDT